MKTPDLLAMELGQAVAIAEREGLKIEVVFTSPPKGAPDGVFRVIRYKTTNVGSIVLTAAKASLW